MSYSIDDIKNHPASERILAALKEARTKLEAVELERSEEVAIVGMAGRFPGAKNVDEFWDNLKNGINSIKFLSNEDLLANGVKAEDLEKQNYVRAYASLAGIDEFDAGFFGYSPREAEILDPQHRLFLECAWEALENAGYDSEQYSGNIAVYGGAALNSYLVNLASNSNYRENSDRTQVVISNVMGLMPTRVSYKLNLTGASCGIQTGCSTSLVSVHIACQSLLNKECDIALAGGVSIGIGEKAGYLYQEDGVLSPDGYCRAFDVNAKGTVFGNGVGIVVLKRLRDAIQDGDHIYAIIKATAINNDGSQKVGLTAPSVTGQAKAITTALTKAKINPETIQYIETHGTGTALGDPIEIAALTKAFSPHTHQKQFCAVGSVKTNIGHLDAAAGISGLIKTALALKHKQIPPSLNFTAANPQIDFANSPFFVNTQLTPWINHQHPRRAGVSSFGMGGTNAHAILEEAPTQFKIQNSKFKINYHLLCLSAKSEKALEQATINLATHLQKHPELNLADVAYTLQIGRRAFNHRRCLVCQTPAQAIEILTGVDASQLLSYSPENTEPSIVFMFPGQGSQYLNMGQELYNTEPVFRKEIDHCSELLQPHLGCDLPSILFKQDNENSPSPQSPVPNLNYELRITNYELLTQTTYAQPALFAVEYALAKLWLSYGIQPQAMIGHSIGEYVAATLAGVFTLADALAIVAQRGKLMQQCPSGVMLSVSLAPEKLQPFLTDDLVIAVHNAPELCVVSGTEAAITLLEKLLTHQNITHRRLHTSHAFHSPLMETAVTPLTQILQNISLHPPQIPFISNVTGTWITPEQATNPNYWATHLRQPVLFAEGITELQQTPNQIFVEVGFGQTLSTFVRQFPDAPPTLSSGRHPQDTQSDVALICKTLGQLWLRGVTINWSELYTQQQRRRLPLPTYPFERQRYWVERDTLPETTSNTSKTLQKQEQISNWFYLPSWRQKPLLRSAAPLNKQRYLVFCHAGNVGERLVQHLQETGQEVVTVKPGEGFTQEGDNYAIAPHNPEDYKTLWLQLQTDDKLPDVIIHSWTLQERTNFQQQQNLGFYSLLWLTQALSSSSLSIYVLTQQVQNVLGNENLNPDDATILGLVKVIPQEYPNLTCQHIDVSISDINFQQLVREINIPPVLSDTLPLEKGGLRMSVAYRGKTRWIQEFQPISLPEPTQLPLITGGVYVIAGDLVEGLGLIYAKFLAATVNAKLVFLGRSDLPQPKEWDNWLATHGRQDAVSHCIQQLQGLQAQGCEFLFTTVDLAEISQVEDAIAQALTRFGKINGVIHAGVMGDRASCLIRNLTIPECEKQFHTKIHGLLALETALKNQPLDFFLLQSSLSAVVGGIGFAAYAGANCFMDAIAHQRTQNSNTHWISINWDAVSLAEITTSTGATLIDLAMTSQEVWQVTERILAQPIAAQITVSPVDLASRQQSQPLEQSTTNHARPQITATYLPPSNEIEARVTQVMESLLGIAPIGVNDNFFELGGHSLLAIQAVSQLREEFQVELPMRQFLFESPTIGGIAKIIIENQSPITDDTEALAALIDQVEQMTPIQVQQLLAE
ncbi:beta-ketoacyl synthase N-terminal-like domain-containing protein [Anabaena sp. FACHB-709]|uniref:Phenolphthiocerol/phthiocerol polyketide synthase subunit E n=2 Tax=Nostocaceae TaxID=1162 RepID=A0A1Z4KGZ7_ANAVA|nr:MULTISPECIES: type I polyketide synthase [Nostocaceae]BAY68256.1 polyketide synthase type I [Trichormus variabilis NIES-23]HBW29987.1 KR domain-containing protein [Nostoc sp. UBA8866]MBD2169668.1 acyltransferase domain-containing protein [Anabaena cylindrica FACHB-318]MBD2261913.1 acyltransferase domain-containing protein [Anabaena sp. FACHB-709]MBD2271498.1 acyltransferase domain-containing protein [Nostoc sp. PCC 7120 = FACHB-418]